MRRKIGVVSIVLGVLFLAAAAGLLAYNQVEDSQAGQKAEAVLDELKNDVSGEGQPEVKTEYVPFEETDASMPTIEIDGYSYIGYLSIPSLSLELPIMEDWDYTRMKIAPCRYYGSYLSGDLVIAGHSYKNHFRPIRNMQPGDLVYFTDVEGNIYTYTVASIEVLGPNDVTEMTESDFPLTLFTCNYSSDKRVTVRCVKE